MFFKKEKKEKTPREILSSFSELEKKVQKLDDLVEEFKKKNEKTIQKIGLVRFNPFSGTGGDQSFSLALLDGKNNGVVITSFYSSGGSSVYGKPIKEGKSSYILSEEEKKAISKAVDEEILIKSNENGKVKIKSQKVKTREDEKKPKKTIED